MGVLRLTVLPDLCAFLAIPAPRHEIVARLDVGRHHNLPKRPSGQEIKAPWPLLCGPRGWLGSVCAVPCKHQHASACVRVLLHCCTCMRASCGASSAATLTHAPPPHAYSGTARHPRAATYFDTPRPILGGCTGCASTTYCTTLRTATPHHTSAHATLRRTTPHCTALHCTATDAV